MITNKLIRFYPIALTAIGVGIHCFGTLGVFQEDVPRAVNREMAIEEKKIL